MGSASAHGNEAQYEQPPVEPSCKKAKTLGTMAEAINARAKLLKRKRATEREAKELEAEAQWAEQPAWELGGSSSSRKDEVATAEVPAIDVTHETKDCCGEQSIAPDARVGPPT